MRRTPGRAALTVAAVLALSGAGSAAASTPVAARSDAGSVPPATRPVQVDGPALTLLHALPVAGRAPRTGYARSQFGPAWADVDDNGCDTRNDVLRRDLRDVVVRAGTRGCVVVRGTLADPYTGRTIAFRTATADAVHVDHVVALSDAWQKGAQSWTPARREQFANDPLNLLAVDGRANQAKGDSDAASWLPPDRSYRCPMVARQVAVKAEYGLRVTPAERDAVARVLATCPGEPVPARTPAPVAAPAPPPAQDPRFPTCRAARTAGHGPYVRDVHPQYAWYDDRDGDGVVCE